MITLPRDSAGPQRGRENVSPHDLDAEKAVLGAALINPAAFATAATVLTAADFFRRAHQRIFAAMATLRREGAPIDLLTVKNVLAQAGELTDEVSPAYISSLTDGVPRSANVEHYARVVKEQAIRRGVIKAAHDGSLDQVRMLLDHAETALPRCIGRGSTADGRPVAPETCACCPHVQVCLDLRRIAALERRRR